MKEKLFHIYFFCICMFQIHAQEIPLLKNFNNITYNAGQQNWAICQGENENIYIANQEGLLKFNGTKWDIFTLKNQKVARSVFTFHSKIFVGSFGEFGYFLENPLGELTYHSLTHLIKNNNFKKEEVWNIVAFQNKIYFQSFSMLFVYDGKKIEQVSTPGNIMFIKTFNNLLYVPVIDKGIYTMNKNHQFTFLQGTEKLQNQIVTSMLLVKDNLFFSTNESGLVYYKDKKVEVFDKSLNEAVTEHAINKLEKLNDDKIFISTISNGLIIYDNKSKKYNFINKAKGLQNNTILSNFVDKDGGLWLGLDRGISYLDLQTPYSYFKDEQGTLGTIYSAAKLNNIKYIGTNQGLYIWNEKVKSFLPHPAIKGQVWELYKDENIIICTHNNGTHIITEKNIKKVNITNGGWQTQKLSNENLYIQGNYNGIVFLKKEGNHLIFSHYLDGIAEGIERIIQLSPYDFLVASHMEGLKKITCSPDYKRIQKLINIGKEHGLVQDKNLEIVKIKNQVFVRSDAKQYLYNVEKNSLSLFDQQDVNYRNVNNTFYKIYKDSIVSILDNFYGNQKIKVLDEYSSIAALDSNEIIYCTDEGYVLSSGKTNFPLKIKPIILDYIKSNKGARYKIDENISIPYKENSISIFFHQSIYNENITYRYKLNYAEQWSDWLKAEDIKLQNLRAGNYNLYIESSVGGKTELSFSILHPWYQSGYMLFLFGLSMIGISYLVKKRYDNELRKNLEIMAKENERIIREHKIELDNQRLKEENHKKSLDLANTTNQLIRKNEILLEIKQELLEIRKTNDILTLKDFQKMVKSINDNVTLEDDNKLFEANFNEVHEVFFKKLLDNFPDLTPNDLKLCAFLKMNLSSKEIAPLFNISIRGLENKRYRLRKKLNLDADVNLTEFFIKW